MSGPADPLMPVSATRLRRKTREDELLFPVMSDPLMQMEEPSKNEKADNWMVTFPHPKQMRSNDGILLVAPSKLSKVQILEITMSCLARPDSRNPANPTPTPIPVKRCGDWREKHQEDENGHANLHDHLALSTGTSFRYLPVKRALLIRHGLASHWSRHHGYNTMVRYLTIPSKKKPKNTLDARPALWDCSGKHPPLIDCVNAPVTQKALEAKRMKLIHEAAENGTEAKVNDFDIMALVVRTGIKNTPDNRSGWMQLAHHAKENCGEAIYHYLWKRRHILPSMIDEIWMWDNIAEHAAASMRSRVDVLKQACRTPCTCNGEWLTVVTSSFMKNGIDVQALCKDVWQALRDGRGETTPVIVLAGLTGGEGKSLFLKSLITTFVTVFNLTREGGGNFPLLDLPLAKVAFLDDYRFDPEILSWATTCLWFDGSDVPIGRPQNEKGATPGNFMYKGTAPIFVTTKLSDLTWLETQASINPYTNAPWDTDASMLFRRLKIYKYTKKVPKPPARLKYCPRCFVDLLISQAGAALH